MIYSDSDYIAHCKRLLEEKFQFRSEGGTLRQRDLEYLSSIIEEKSGIRLSLSTLKRLWKKDYEQTPHPSTLQALVSLLGYKDWQEFKLKELPGPKASFISAPNRVRKPYKRWLVFSIVAVIPFFIWLLAFREGKNGKKMPLIKGPITFTGNKTVSQGVPNTVIFNYDLRNVKADSFFFQQSWNELERVRLDPNGKHYSTIYYYPGFHRAKLIANDSIIKIFRVHITTDGWMPLARYSYPDLMPIHLKETGISNGALHITKQDLISSNVNIEKEFIVSYFNVREFENTHSDNFSIDTRVRSDSMNTISCPGIELLVMCEAHIFYVRMMGKGCERHTSVKMGEVIHDGSRNDLSVFGRDLYNWQRLQIKVQDKKSTIYFGEQPVYTMAFEKDFGKVTGLAYNFLGTGAIDYVRLRNADNKLVFEDAFDN